MSGGDNDEINYGNNQVYGGEDPSEGTERGRLCPSVSTSMQRWNSVNDVVLPYVTIVQIEGVSPKNFHDTEIDRVRNVTDLLSQT